MIVQDELFAEVTTAVTAHQPELRVMPSVDFIVLEGSFVVSGPKGPFDHYQIHLEAFSGFPWQEPVVFETGRRIPKIADRHIFSEKGDCCLGVWEEWLLTASDYSFETFLTGWLHDYFVGQSWFEAKGEWPFGQRSHGTAGIVEAYADLLGVLSESKVIADHLRLLVQAKLKGQALCPCGSGLRLRKCHMENIRNLRKLICPKMAKRMLARIALC